MLTTGADMTRNFMFCNLSAAAHRRNSALNAPILLDVFCVVRVEEELVQENGCRTALETGLVAGGRRPMEELVRDIHAVRLEIRKAVKPRAVRIVDIAQPCLEYAMAKENVCRAHALVEPLPDRLVREADVLRHLAFHGDLYARLKNHDVRHRRTANPLAVEKRVRGELKELERTDGVEVGEMPVKKSPDPTEVRRLPEFGKRNRTCPPRINSRLAELAQYLTLCSTGKSKEVPAFVIYHFFPLFHHTVCPLRRIVYQSPPIKIFPLTPVLSRCRSILFPHAYLKSIRSIPSRPLSQRMNPYSLFPSRVSTTTAESR